MRTALGVDVDHADLSMPLAVDRGLAALDIEGRKRLARVVQAMPATDVDHAVLSMKPTVCGRFTSLAPCSTYLSWCPPH